MSFKVKEILTDAGLVLLGMLAGFALAWLVLSTIAWNYNKENAQPTCFDGIYTIRDGNKLETIYLQAEDTCRLEKK